MNRRTRIVLAAVLVVIAALLLIRLGTKLERVEEEVTLGPGPEARRNPVLAATRLLQARGL